MNVQQQIRTASADGTGHFRCCYRGRRHFRVGAAYHLTKQCAGTSFVVLETQKEFWRNLADPPLSRHPVRQRPAYLRLPFKPWTSAPIATARRF